MHRSAMDYRFFLISVYPIVTVFSPHVLDTNTVVVWRAARSIP